MHRLIWCVLALLMVPGRFQQPSLRLTTRVRNGSCRTTPRVDSHTIETPLGCPMANSRIALERRAVPSPCWSIHERAQWGGLFLLPLTSCRAESE